MRLTKTDQKGFGLIEWILVVVVIGAIVFLTLNVINSQEDGSDSTAPANTETSETAEPIKSSEDLENVERELENTDLEQLDSGELDAAEEELL